LLGTIRRITPAVGVTSGAEIFNIGAYRPDSGLPFLVVAADRDNLVDESDETNNSARIQRVIDLSPMQVQGTFTYNEPLDRFEAAGGVQIGLKPPDGEAFTPLISLTSGGSYNGNTIEAAGLATTTVLGETVNLFTGTVAIDFRTATANRLSPTGNGFTLADLPFLPTSLAFVNPGGGSTIDSILELQGWITLPLIDVTVAVEGTHRIQVGANGFAVTGGRVVFPNVDFMFFGVDFSAEDLAIEYFGSQEAVEIPDQNSFRIQGKLVMKNFAREQRITADLTGDNFLRIKGQKVDLVGSITAENIRFGEFREVSTNPPSVRRGPVLLIKSIKLSADTTRGDFRIEGQVQFRPLTGERSFLFGAGLLNGSINFVSFGVDDISFPLPSFPAIFLQKLQVGCDNLADIMRPLECFGTVGFSGGPKYGPLTIQNISPLPLEGELVRLEGTVRYSKDKIALGGELSIIFKEVFTGTIEGEINNKEGVIKFKGTINALNGLLTGNGSLTIDATNDGNFRVTGMATLRGKAPTVRGSLFLRGQDIADVTTYVQYRPDSNPDNDFFAAFFKTNLKLLGERNVGIRVYPDGRYEVLTNLVGIVPVGGRSAAAVGFARAASNSPAFNVEAGTDALLLAASWENDVGLVPVEIVAPDGTVFTEADFDPARMAVIDDLSGPTDRSVGVLDPEPGVWMIRIADSDGLGEVQFNAFRDTAEPTIDVTSAATGAAGGSIGFNAADADSDANVSFFYDTDGEGFDGVLIDETFESDSAATFPWDTSDVPDGTYFVYAMIDDGNNAPVFDYFETPVTVDNTAPTVLGAALAPDAARRNVAAINVAFDEAIATLGANNIANYVVRAAGRDKRLGTADDVTVRMRSATLDPATNSVRLVPMTAQKLNQFLQINVLAKTDLTDVAGNALAADAAPGVAFSTIAGLGTKLNVVDPDGDTVSLTLTRGGLMQLTADSTGVRLRLDGTTGASTLTGSVKQPRRGGGGNGTAVIQSITAPTTFVNRLPASIVVNDPIQPVLAAVIDELLLESGAVRA